MRPINVYGRPDDLKALIDEAHLRRADGISRRRLQSFRARRKLPRPLRAAFFTKAQTPWGSGHRLSGAGGTRLCDENALNWLGEYRFDGLRLDAVNTIVECGEIPILHDLSAAVGKLAEETGRHIHSVLENGDTAPSLLDPAQEPPRGKYRGQWERRLPPRLACHADRRIPGLLRRLSGIAARRPRARAWLRLRLPG